MILLPLLLQASAPPGADCAQPQTQSEMDICASRDHAATDAALNAQWEITAAIMRERDETANPEDGRPGYFQTLLAGQRAWLDYRDAHCAVEGYYARGGSMEPMLVSDCKAALTARRTEQLRELAEWP